MPDLTDSERQILKEGDSAMGTPVKATRVAHEALWEAVGVAAMTLAVVLLGSIV